MIINFQISTIQTLKFGEKQVISSDTFRGLELNHGSDRDPGDIRFMLLSAPLKVENGLIILSPIFIGST